MQTGKVCRGQAMSAKLRGMRHTTRRWRRDHPIFPLLGVNLGAGLFVAAIAVGGLLLLDTHGLRSLILRDQAPVAALLLLSFGFAITFGSLLMGSAIMRLPREAPQPPHETGHGDRSEPLHVRVRSD
jgi:hypothetical protein